jgi:putative chitinase
MSSIKNADYLMQTAQKAGITDIKELANFMGQMQVESSGFTSMNENLHYSAARLLAVFPGRNGMQTTEQAKAIVAQGPEGIANAIYGGPWGTRYLGNTQEGDGWRYHGRGYVQLTGRDNYAAAGQALGLNLIHHPELAADREVAARIAVHYWQTRVVAHGHQHDVTGASHDINGGEKGLAERRNAANVWEHRLYGYHQDAGTLRQGTHSPAVTHLQTQLNALGYTDAQGQSLRADGHFGPATRDAVKAFQRDHGLAPDGVAGSVTLNQLQALNLPQAPTRQPQAPSIPLIGDPMFQQAQAGVHQLDAERGRTPDIRSDQLSASLTVAARKAGLSRIDSVWLSEDASKVFAVQGLPGSPEMKLTSLSTLAAVNTPMAQSAQALEQVRPEPSQTPLKPEAAAPPPQLQSSRPALVM